MEEGAVVLSATQESIQVCEALMEVYHRKLVLLAGRLGFTRHDARLTLQSTSIALQVSEARVLEVFGSQYRRGG